MTSSDYKVGDEVVLIRDVDGVPPGTEGVITHKMGNWGIRFSNPDQEFYDEDDRGYGRTGPIWWVDSEDIELLMPISNIIEPSEDIYNDLI